jgi:hypothetical protein
MEDSIAPPKIIDNINADSQAIGFDMPSDPLTGGLFRLLAETIALLKVGGLYIIDDMLPHANWPVGHADKVAELILTLDRHPDLNIVKMSWASGIIVGVKSSPQDETI